MATVGGGLIHADPAQDPPPALMVLNSYVELSSSRGIRELLVKDLFLDYYESALEPGELLTKLIVPPAPKGARLSTLSSYRAQKTITPPYRWLLWLEWITVSAKTSGLPLGQWLRHRSEPLLLKIR